MKKKKIALGLALLIILVFTQSNNIKAEEKNKKPITFMYYCDADNDLEPELLNDVEEIKRGVNDEINVVTLVDRSNQYSSDESVFGENFYDTRLYKIEKNKVERIEGGEQFPEITTESTAFEGNMGDANTLKRFIDFCKEKYPADKYVLVLSNHGGGPKTEEEKETRKAICWDETDNMDTLYTGEISDVLTKEQSVDVFGLDACFMGNAEFAYQFYKGNGGFEAEVMIASSPTEWGDGWKYDTILDRLQSKEGDNGEDDLTLGGMEKYYSPREVTPAEIGGIIVEEQRDSCENSATDQALACYDLSKISEVKVSVDELAVLLQDEKEKMEEIRGKIGNPKIMCYFNVKSKIEQMHYPFFDLYDLTKKIAESKDFEDSVKEKATEVMTKIDDMIIYSYGGIAYTGFEEGKNGLSIFLPSGDSKIYMNRKWHNHFEYQYWYTPLDLTHYLANGDDCYGKLKWCQDGLTEEINKVGNWFELLDCWYDKENNIEGGYNEYQW